MSSQPARAPPSGIWLDCCAERSASVSASAARTAAHAGWSSRTRKQPRRWTWPGGCGYPDPVIEADRLLVYRVLLRDRAAIAELVGTVLGPLRGARGGAEPLLATLQAYFGARGVSAVAARRLQVGVRTVTYRLHRVKQLTGHAVTDPDQRFTLEAAVLGARLLDWPRQPLPSTVDPPGRPAATPPMQPAAPPRGPRRRTQARPSADLPSRSD